MGKSTEQDRPTNLLGRNLKQAREVHGLSLRAVEKVTDISNAYLSQLESGRIGKPSPNILHKLAELYGLAYDQLMETAGYIVKRSPSDGTNRTLSGAALSAISDLTPDEENELMQYISFLRSRRSKI